MRILTEKGTRDATAVKVLTIMTLIYLPATVVSVSLTTPARNQRQSLHACLEFLLDLFRRYRGHQRQHPVDSHFELVDLRCSDCAAHTFDTVYLVGLGSETSLQQVSYLVDGLDHVCHPCLQIYEPKAPQKEPTHSQRQHPRDAGDMRLECTSLEEIVLVDPAKTFSSAEHVRRTGDFP
jgi:hypothetical protein